MKPTLAEMKVALEAFERDGKVEESYSRGESWCVTSDPTWDFESVLYRPVQKPIVTKYLCYEHEDGELSWCKKGTLVQENLAKSPHFTHITEFDKEVVR